MKNFQYFTLAFFMLTLETNAAVMGSTSLQPAGLAGKNLGLPMSDGGKASNNTGDYAGFYVGGVLAVTHKEATINKHKLSATGYSGGGLMGYGAGITEKVFGAGELEVSYGIAKSKDDGNTVKLRSTYDASFAGLIGYLLAGAYMPYLRIGAGSHGYNYNFQKSGKTQTTKFHTFFVAPGVGMQFYLGKSFFIRIEGSYAFPISVAKIKKSLVDKKPKRAFLRLGAAYKF